MAEPEPGLRVAVVESDDAVRDVMVDILERAGYSAAPVSDTATLHDVLVAVRPHLIVLDLRFAGDFEPHRAWDLLHQVRTHGELSGVPVLIASGDTRALLEEPADLRADPMVDALAKPFGVAEFEHRVAKLLDASRAADWDDEDDIVLVADGESRLLDASTRALRVLGLTMEELRSRSVADIVAETREWAATEWQRYVETRRWSGTVKLRTADGSELEAASSAEILQRAGREWHISRLEPKPGAEALS